MYTLKLDVAGSPQGAELVIPGLGIFKNGESYQLSEEDCSVFQAVHSETSGEVVMVDGAPTLVYTTELGVHPKDANFQVGITVNQTPSKVKEVKS